MLRFITRRLVLAIFTLLGISIVIFLLIRIIPGDVIEAKLGTEASALTPTQMAELRAYFGLDKPLYLQYLNWLGSTLTGNLGYSMRTGRPVISEILDRLPVTLELTFGGVCFGTLIGVIAGILSALRQNTIWDWIGRVGALVGLSIPQFWLATLLILVFSLYLRVMPNVGMFVGFFSNPVENLTQVALPSFCLSVMLGASVMRMVRSSMLEVMGEDYIRTARSKGLAPQTVISAHALRNCLIPVVTIIGIQAGYMLGGTVAIEEIFALPGVGRLTLHAIYDRDYAMIQGAILVIALNFIVINLFVDTLYSFIDPRIRYD